MIISTTFLTNALNKYKAYKERRENFSNNAAQSGATASFLIFLLIIAIIFFTLEVLLLFYSIYIAVRCTKGGAERIVHITLAIFFTMPYALLNAVFSNCAKQTLRGEGGENYKYNFCGCGNK